MELRPRIGYWDLMKRDNDARVAVCEKCGSEITPETTSRIILDDGQLHAFCEACVEHLLIIKDGSFQL